VFFVLFSVLAMVGAAVLFREFVDASAVSIIAFFVGCAHTDWMNSSFV
jgi:hypothetical protein